MAAAQPIPEGYLQSAAAELRLAWGRPGAWPTGQQRAAVCLGHPGPAIN